MEHKTNAVGKALTSQHVRPLVNEFTSEVIKNVFFLFFLEKPPPPTHTHTHRKANERKWKARALKRSAIKLDINKCISLI